MNLTRLSTTGVGYQYLHHLSSYLNKCLAFLAPIEGKRQGYLSLHDSRFSYMCIPLSVIGPGMRFSRQDTRLSIVFELILDQAILTFSTRVPSNVMTLKSSIQGRSPPDFRCDELGLFPGQSSFAQKSGNNFCVLLARRVMTMSR